MARTGLVLGALALLAVGGLVWFLVAPSTRGRIGDAPSSQAPPAPAASRGSAAGAEDPAIRPRSVAAPEDEAPAAASKPGALEIEVTGPKGRPAANAGLVLTRGRDVLGAAKT